MRRTGSGASCSASRMRWACATHATHATNRLGGSAHGTTSGYSAPEGYSVRARRKHAGGVGTNRAKKRPVVRTPGRFPGYEARTGMRTLTRSPQTITIFLRGLRDTAAACKCVVEQWNERGHRRKQAFGARIERLMRLDALARSARVSDRWCQPEERQSCCGMSHA